jgi:hypothetical protein
MSAWAQEETLEQTGISELLCFIAAKRDHLTNNTRKANTMTRKTIEFAPTPEIAQLKAPGDRPGHPIFEDLIFKDEFKNRKLKLETGSNWIIPALMESNNWMLNIPVIGMKHARFAHPRTLQKGNKGVFDLAYRWFADNSPDKLYNRNNPTGYRLLCSSLCAFWCLVENKEGKVEARLFLGSANDGVRGGSPGLGFRIEQLRHERDEDGNLVSDPTHPNRGSLVCIEKNQQLGVKYPAYMLRAGRQPAPIQSFLDRMDDSELDVLRPIEQTIREVTEEEQWDHLAKVVGADTVSKIRSSDA